MAAEELNKPPSLPSYPQLIINAIEALNDKNGSNKTSISKYIESKYGDLLAGDSTLLSHHLNRMKETGELIFWKNHYTKPDSNAPPRRARGRPPKSKVPLPPGMILSSSRPRGRPPKDPDAPPSPPKPSGSGKPRGRPRKMALPKGGIDGIGSTATMMSPSVRPRGRPPKVKALALSEVSVEN